MAEGGSTWWGTLLSTAREKSSNVLEFMKRDLDEFTHAVQQETKSYVSSAAGALKDTLNIEDTGSTANKVKRSFSTFLGTVSQALTTPNENEDPAELCVIRNSEPVVMDRIQAQVYSVQTNSKTYLEDPEDDEYEDWMMKFDLETKQNEMADILACNSQVEKFYSTLVPNSVSHVVFWHRYFFKMHKILLAEAKKQEIVRRVNEPTENDEIAWDDDDDFSNNSDVSEEQATKILVDYQNEIHRQKGKLVMEPWEENSPRKITENGSVNASKNNQESFVMVEKTPSMLVITPSTPVTDSGTTIDDTPSSESSLIKSPENSSDASLVTKEKGDLVVVGRSTSVGTSPASSNKEGSNDEEWERDFELESTEDDTKNPQSKTITKPQVDDVSI